MRAKFQVYDSYSSGSGAGAMFLVQNQKSAAYNTGINAESGYTNNGTAKFQVLNGLVRPVLPINYPRSG